MRVYRMCGGGIPHLRRRFWWRIPGSRLGWPDLFSLRRVRFEGVGGLVWDWVGIGVFWGPKR